MTPGDLHSHDFVRFAWTPITPIALSRRGETVHVPTWGRFRVNNAAALREALVMGGGIGICSDWHVFGLLERGALVRVLDGWWAPHQELHLLYPSRKYQALRTELFIEFAAKEFAALKGCCAPGTATPASGEFDVHHEESAE